MPGMMSRRGLVPRVLPLWSSGALWTAGAALPTCKYAYRPDVSPQFPNGTEMCCGECRFISAPESCVRPDVTVVLVLAGVWIGAMVAFFFDRVFGSPLPGSLGVNCRRRFYACAPCLGDLCFSQQALLEVSTAASRLQRNGLATVEEEFVAAGGDDTECFFIDEDDDDYERDRGRRWRERALRDEAHDGLDDLGRANVTVHSF
ncbi:pr39 [rat cytomegalovirus strain Maastricht]|uniref:Pr39 n=1 Tax=Rat cytomegalovirus (strain Maastricht) TaxID=79700 RepID=Q9DWF2_RCMVM|nr:pr39 [rat cytomegalovirus strain Maastricht]AAF99137.1 pr39 [rat cytomegalovirus strain Maastricht]WEG71964.1 membrane protein m39 [Murid betaherpesvirus 2]